MPDTVQLRVPSFIKRADDADAEHRLSMVREGAGLASKLARGMGLASASPAEQCDYEALRDEMYDELIDRMDARHV